MKKLLSFLVLSLLSISSIFAQETVTSSIKLILIDLNEIVMPPDLYVDIDFQDSNDNKVLEANESGTIKLVISNKGGKADQITVSINPDKYYNGLVLEKNKLMTSVAKNGDTQLFFPIRATWDIPTDSVKLNIDISEPQGYDISAVMLLSTFEYQRPNLKIQGVNLVDVGMGLRAFNDNPDGKLQKSEVARAFVTIQNIGQGTSQGVSYTIKSYDPNVSLMTDRGYVSEISGFLKDLKIGETEEINFRISPNNKYTKTGRYVPVSIVFNDYAKWGKSMVEDIPLPLDEVPEKVQVQTIDANIDQLLAMRKTEVFSSSSRISSGIKIRDISIAPVGVPLYANAIAIVLGAEKNNYNIAPAPYAARDAEIISKYFKTSMGIKDVRVYTNEQVTKTTLSDIFDSNGELQRSVVPGVTDVFVFYSGHGMPDKDIKTGNQDIYLFPYDGRRDMLKERGYSLNRLYSNLAELGAKSVTVILDACFSGSSRQSSTFEAVSIGNTKGVEVRLKNMGVRPWETDPNFRLMTSSDGEQTSLGLDQSKTGLFTYYLATGLQGDADLNGDGEITMGELKTFVTDNVSSKARQIRNGDQTPQLFGNDDFVVAKIR